jgi:beta-glucosidase
LEGEEMQVDFDDYSGGDRRRIELPPPQQRLLEKLHATGKPLVYVNLSGSAVAMPWASEHANAILQAWYPGQAGGTAVADVLLGSYNPAGRLPVTFYRSTSDLPEFANYAMANRTYRYFKGTPLYPFGHGLSYTKFDYSNLQVERRTDGNISVSVVIKNAGGRDGDEVVQLYAVPPSASHPRETEALCGFHRLHLAKDETRTVTMVVPASAFRRWNPEKDDYDIPRGEWTIRAGASSTDIRQNSPLKIQDTQS